MLEARFVLDYIILDYMLYLKLLGTYLFYLFIALGVYVILKHDHSCIVLTS